MRLLTTGSFIQAFTRFVSRRGPPIEVYSDNGTNFKGAEAKIKIAWKHGEKWNINPAHASHTGGVWERMISSICRILRALLGCQLVDNETLLTLTAEVEKILNYHPLTPPASDLNDPEPLSPSELLLLQPNVCYPTGESDAVHIYRSKRWKHAQYLTETSSGNVGP